MVKKAHGGGADRAIKESETPPPRGFGLLALSAQELLDSSFGKFLTLLLSVGVVLTFISNWEHHGGGVFMGLVFFAVILFGLMILASDMPTMSNEEATHVGYVLAVGVLLTLFLPTLWMTHGFFPFVRVGSVLFIFWIMMMFGYIFSGNMITLTLALLTAIGIGTLTAWSIPLGTWTKSAEDTYVFHEEAVPFGLLSGEVDEYFVVAENGEITLTNLPEHWQASGTFTVKDEYRHSQEAIAFMVTHAEGPREPTVKMALPVTTDANITFEPTILPNAQIEAWLEEDYRTLEFVITSKYTPPAATAEKTGE